MKAFFDNFSITQIIIFFILGALAVKECLTIIDWFKNRGKNYYDAQEEDKKEKEHLQENLNKNSEDIKKMAESQIITNEHIQKMSEKIDILIESDKDDIKSFITKEYHYFVEQKQWIDKFSLDCIEKRYKHYQDEGGNSFVASLMDEIRRLPKQPPQH